MEDNVPGNSIDSVVDRADLTAISQIQDISSSDQATECLLSKEITSGPTPTKPSSAATAAISSPSSIVPKVAKPEWATGDPFFDTMAGMDNSLEYKRYYGGLEQTSGTSSSSHGLADHTASMAISDISVQNDTLAAGSASASSSSSSAYTNTGLDHWNRTREQWTKGQWHVVRSANSNNPALSAIHPKNHDAIYDSLIYDRKRLSKPIPLPLVIKVLVSGWKRDGLWQESPAQPQSGPTSGQSSAPTSTPSHGLHAYVPGFSSTNSQPIQRKL